jgi:hypothetical protein
MVADMTIYVLLMWSITVPPFVAGEYQSIQRCEDAAQVQRVGLRHLYGPHRLHWRCELREQTS